MVTSNSSPETTGSANAPAMGSLSDIWAKIVAQLTPMGTQVLMRQHGQLIACDGVDAQVGITNDKLMRMAQDRLRNVETAFEKVFGHKIRVAMVVAKADKPPELTTSPPSAPSPSARPVTIPSPTPPPAPVQQTQPAPAESSSSTDRPSDPTEQTAVSANGQPNSDWKVESDLERSVKSFAQFFNGQIVNLDDEPAPSKPSKATTEPGPDVPF